ncbi:MAG TPA: cytochrome P450 [Anaerolineales bacterium]|nr:cytochrome P450 [Anaerolineales bacterium]
MNTPTLPPTVPGLPILGNAPAFIMSNGISVEFLQKIQQSHGDLVHFKALNQSFYLVSSAELIREVLLERMQEVVKLDSETEGAPRGLRRFLGNGILTANYDDWRPQRKLIQPLLHTKQIAKYADTIGAMGERMLAGWQDGETRNIHADMTQVTLWVIADTMFGIDFQQSTELEQAGRMAQKIVVDDLVNPLPGWLTGRDAKAERINTLLTQLVTQFLEEHRTHPNRERHDLLSVLLDTRDEDGKPLSDELLRDNILTMFFAGHETTANTLSWALYYLAKNPAVLQALQAEVDVALADGHTPTLADLPRLPYTQMVLKETMRIQPTVAMIPRLVAKDITLGGYALKAGAVLLISPYVQHHNPQKWQTPTVFDPTRFSAESEANIGKYDYLPFGAGPRICIGNHFAMMEGQILLALVVRHYDLQLPVGSVVEPLRQITCEPENGLAMLLHKR